MPGYVFIGNSSKPSPEKNNSRAPVVPGNVSIPGIKAALRLGYTVYLGTNRNHPEELACEYPVKLFDAHTYRSITAFRDNKIAYRNLSEVVKKGDVEVIHCNTPVGGLIGRLVGKKLHVKKVIYTAHGFHFYKGAPLINRTVFKWAEKLMAHWTDALITMNEEDYQAAKRFRLKKGGKVYKVHGVGIDLSQYTGAADPALRASLGIAEEDIVLISAGDLVERKNYSVALRAIAETGLKNLKYCICGTGPLMDRLRQEATDLGIEDQVLFLGFRSDVKALLKISDLFLFTTKQEGLPRSMMEAMASGLPCIVSRIRGNTDLIEEGKGGFLCDPADADGFAGAIRQLCGHPELRRQMREYNLEKIRDYDVSVVEKEIMQIYTEVLGSAKEEKIPLPAN